MVECGPSARCAAARAEAAQEVILQEVALAPLRFDGHAEHPEREQVEDEMPEVAVKERGR